MKKPYAILGALILSTPVLALAQRERPRTIQVEVDRPTPVEIQGDQGTAWIAQDDAAKTVTMEIRAGATGANGGLNFNGLHDWTDGILVPQGHAITIHFANVDATRTHSLGIIENRSSWSETITAQPAFAGAMTPDPTTSGTPPGGTASITFAADRVGGYAMADLIPGHAAAGMHVDFVVSPPTATGEPAKATTVKSGKSNSSCW